MGRFAPKYNDDQRRAIVTAVLDEGLSCPKAVELAKGQGLAGLEPFDFNVRYARELAAKERRKRQGKTLTPLARQGPRIALEQLLVRTISLVDRELEALERSGRGKLDTARLEALTRCLKGAQQNYGDLMLRPSKAGNKGGKAPEPRQLEAEQRGSAFTRQVAAQHGNGDGGVEGTDGEVGTSTLTGQAQSPASGPAPTAT